MASVLNRSTLEYLESVNTPDYSPDEWVINPDLSAVRDQPTRYWKLEGDRIVLKSSEEIAEADSSHLVDEKESAQQALRTSLWGFLRANVEVVTQAILGNSKAQEDLQKRLEKHQSTKEGVDKAVSVEEIRVALKDRDKDKGSEESIVDSKTR